MEFLQEVGVFLAEALIIVAAILIVVIGVTAVGQRRRGGDEGYIEVRRLNDKYTAFRDAIRSVTEYPEERKARLKLEKQAAKEEEKQVKARLKGKSSELAEGESSDTKSRLFVLYFDGDMRASAVDALREEISALLPDVGEGDEVLLCLESPGGLVHAYGLAASQLKRLRNAGVTLTIAVDKVAASGGYMMACIADRIIAAPFAVIGSIGVLAQIPNFHRLLKKNDVDFELLTAGKYKRTMTMLGENTEADRKKFIEDLEDTFELFKEFVKDHRPVVDIESVATGEIWYGQRALEKQLIDEISTSDDYIQTRLLDGDVLEVRYVPKKSWQEKLGMAAEGSIDRVFTKLWQQAASRYLP